MRDSIRRAQALLGTFVEVEVAGSTSERLNKSIEAAFDAVADVHRLMSLHDSQSDLSRLNQSGCLDPLAIHPWTYRVLQKAVELYDRTAGLFDVTASPLLPNKGKGTRPDDATCLQLGRAPFPLELLAKGYARWREPHFRIDLGGIAKGFAVDCAVDALRAHGVTQGLVNAGGDLAVFGTWSKLINIRDPRDPRRILCSLGLTDAALASTGQRFDPFQNSQTSEVAVIDPRNGNAVAAIAGASVSAPSCMIADALTKVVMIDGEQTLELLKYYRASAFVVPQFGKVRITSDWQDAVRSAA